MTTPFTSYDEFFGTAFTDRSPGNAELSPRRSRLRRSAGQLGTRQPFDYQRRLATEEPLPSLINVPTGAGKTAAVIGAWLWRRLKNPASVGRRLIYCLPIRMRWMDSKTHAFSFKENLL